MVEHWKCSRCRTDITYQEENAEDKDLVEHIYHFDISRSNKTLSVDVEGSIEEDMKERNTKMERNLCEGCFNQILHESKTLRGLFAEDGKIIY